MFENVFDGNVCEFLGDVELFGGGAENFCQLDHGHGGVFFEVPLALGHVLLAPFWSLILIGPAVWSNALPSTLAFDPHFVTVLRWQYRRRYSSSVF